MTKISQKKDLSKKLIKLRRKEKIWDNIHYMFTGMPDDVGMGALIGGLISILAVPGGLFAGGLVGEKLYYDKVDAARSQISDEILQIAQEKAVNFNEKFGESITIPTTNNVEISDLGKTISSDAVDSVRSDVADLVNDKILNIPAGGVSGEIHGFSYGTITGTDGEILVKPGFENYVIERGQYLQNELGSSLNNDISEIVNTAVPAANDVSFSALVGLGCGFIPLAIAIGIPIVGNLGSNIALDKWYKYHNEAKELSERIQSEQFCENSK